MPRFTILHSVFIDRYNSFQWMGHIHSWNMVTSKFDLEILGKGHGWSQRLRSYSWSYVLSICIIFLSCQLNVLTPDIASLSFCLENPRSSSWGWKVKVIKRHRETCCQKFIHEQGVRPVKLPHITGNPYITWHREEADIWCTHPQSENSAFFIVWNT